MTSYDDAILDAVRNAPHGMTVREIAERTGIKNVPNGHNKLYAKVRTLERYNLVTITVMDPPPKGGMPRLLIEAVT